MDALNTVKTILKIKDDTLDADITVYLNLANAELLNWTYGADTVLTEIPDWLVPVQIMAVVTGYNQQGAEGETSESVDGVSHQFKYDSMVDYIHRNAPAYAKVL